MGAGRHRGLMNRMRSLTSCVCQVLQKIGSPRPRNRDVIPPEPPVVAWRYAGSERSAQGRAGLARLANPCARAPIWHLRCDDGWFGGITPHPAGGPRDGFDLLMPLASSAPFCALSGTPYADISWPQSSSRASRWLAPGSGAGRPPLGKMRTTSVRP